MPNQARSASSIGVAIIEDSAMLGELIEETIAQHPSMHLTARVRNIRDAHDSIPWAQTQLASIDLHLPDGLGISLGKRIRVSYPHVRILILSDHRRPSLLAGLELEDLPFWSYTLKSSIDGKSQLAGVIHKAAVASYIDPNIHTSRTGTEVAIADLSDQQRQILALVSRGMSNGAIASRMGVTDKAVEYHLKQIYAALQLASASDANQRVMAAVAYLQQYAPNTHV